MRINKLFLFSIVFLFIASSVSAMTIHEPFHDGVLTESITFLNYSTSLINPTSCWYNLNNRYNITLPDCDNIWIEIPVNRLDFHYEVSPSETDLLPFANLTVFETNGTDTISDTALFHLDNEFGNDGKGVLTASLIGFIFLLSFILWYPCFKLDSLHVPIKFGLTILGFFMPLVGLIASRSVIEQYIHSGALKSIFDSLIIGYTWLLYAIISYFLIVFIIYVMALISDHKKNKEAMI